MELSHCDLGHVLLSHSDLNTDGTYLCEVSAEAPSFHTERAERELRVYVLPKEGPKITGTKSQYLIGDKVEINCVAAPSKPPAILKWLVNDKESPKENLCRLENIRHKNGLQASQMGLHFAVQPFHLWNGVLKLRCTALISQAYSMSSEEIIVGNTSRASGLYSSANNPIINGGLLKYQVGDKVNVNCSSAKSKKPATLSWFINDRKAQPVSLLRYPMTQYEGGLKSSALGLQFTVRAHHFDEGEMRLKCTATLLKVINTNSKETIIERHQQTSGLHVYGTSPGNNKSGKSIHRSWMTLTSIVIPLTLQLSLEYIV
ncbi:uncharacterized protein LOC106472805 [Limulus polyphemus]|uniref:Uncharacterized protein LOC106472805 n=1 Tax=Limulus polyphemus TaxID=6850 RepID=A0ABM1TME9_LIMPO|nr:uncharacterized protein LOC106472805 [Limulus polyphemus]